MSSPWAGSVAKAITGRKRTRKFWNIFFIVIITIILVCLSIFLYQIACENMTHSCEQTFVEYTKGCLITDSGSYDIPVHREEKIEINKLMSALDKNDVITLVISDVSGKLISVMYGKKTVYKVSTIDVIPSLIAMTVIVLPVLAFCIFMLIVTNIKEPKSKRIDKLQSQFLLRSYDVK